MRQSEQDWAYVDKLITLGLAGLLAREASMSDELTRSVVVSGAYILYIPNSSCVYIGSSGNLYRRKKKHVELLRTGTHSNPTLRQLSQYNVNLHQEFLFFTYPTNTVEEAIELEQLLLDKYSGNPRLCNVSIDAKHHAKGLKRTDEHRKKVTALRNTPFFKERHAEAARAAWRDPEKAARLLAANQKKGKKVRIEGVEYPSAAEAARVLGMNKYSLVYRINSKHFGNWEWVNEPTESGGTE